MTLEVSRRSFVAMGVGVASMAVASSSRAATLASPSEKPILKITGKIRTTNDGDAAVFDRPMLEGLGTSIIRTKTPWYSGVVTFEGVRMDALMQRVGVAGDVVTAVALNDFSSEIPVSDFAKYGVILALKRDGNYMPVSDKGPLFIVYPYDSSPELQAQKFYSRSAWQLAQLIAK